MTSLLSGVSPDCIRAWERRYAAITPSRDNGRRVFTDGDVKRLLMLKELSEYGNPISTVAKMNDADLIELCQKLGLKLTLKSPAQDHIQHDPQKSLDYLFVALESFRLEMMIHELHKASEEYNSRDFALQIMSPFLDKIFSMYHQHKFSLNQKKSLLKICNGIILKKISTQSLLDREGNYAIICHFPGEGNEVRSLLSGLILSHHGYQVNPIGLGTDPDLLSEIVKMTSAKVLHLELATEINLAHFVEKLSDWKGEMIISGSQTERMAVHHLPIKLTFLYDCKSLDAKLMAL